MKRRNILAALVGVSIVAVAASFYAYKARESALNAWDAYAELGPQTDAQNQPLYERAVRADAGLPLTGAVDPAEADAAVRDYIHRTNVTNRKFAATLMDGAARCNLRIIAGRLPKSLLPTT